ncbi:hypothetical protein [Corynebacterium striatum]
MNNQQRALEAIAAAIDGFTAPEAIPEKAVENLQRAGLLTPDSVTYQEVDYRHPGFYIVDETTERGPELGGHVTRAKRLVGPWEEA